VVYLSTSVKLAPIARLLIFPLPKAMKLRNDVTLADYLVLTILAISGRLFRFESEIHPICKYLKASKLLTSENRFLYH
jgi:hypothetical protein